MKINFIFRKKGKAFSIEEVFESIISALPNDIEVEKTYMPYSRMTPINILRNIIYSHKMRNEINHITGDVHISAIGTGKNTILTIHDINSILKGNIIKILFLKIFWFWIPAMIISKITVISEFTKEELIKVIPFAKRKISVVHNPYNELITFEPKIFDQNNPSILHIGTKENKNLIRVIQALSKIKCRLVIVGKLDEKQRKALADFNIEYSNKFDIPFSEINHLYHQCDIVSFPSLYEGFGMPILEGNKAGRPVLASNICSMPEIAGEAACLIDPTNIDDIKKGFLKIISNQNYREQLIENGYKNIERFKPEKISKDYIHIYNQILKK